MGDAKELEGKDAYDALEMYFGVTDQPTEPMPLLDWPEIEVDDGDKK